MKRIAPLATLASLALATAASTTATASPEARDHRTVEAHPSHVDSPPPRRRYKKRVGPSIMMPLRLDIGATGANTTQGYMPGVEMKLGIHWASLSPKPTNFDVGLGLFGAVLPGAEDEAMPEVDNDVAYGGAYLEVGQTLSSGAHWRTWAAGRGEYLGSSTFGDTQAGFGVAGRLSAELFLSGVGIEPRGLFLGTYAIGAYVEAGARGLGEDVNPVQVSAGLTFRTPLVFMP